MLQRPNACGARPLSRAIVLGLVTISLISLCLASTPVEARLRIDLCSIVFCELTTFDVPGATNTDPMGINSQGQIAGVYRDSVGHDHGFVRDANGYITFPIDYPGGGGTALRGINDLGQVTGPYKADDGIYYGFVRDANGQFSGPIRASRYATYTVPLAINNLGQVTGYYTTAEGFYYGFVRDTNGTINTIDITLPNTHVEGSAIGPNLAINNMGQVAGTYFYNGNFHGIVSDVNGNGTPLPLPSSSTSRDVYFRGINDLGQVTGTYKADNGIDYGFVLDANGTTLYKIQVDSALHTIGLGINNRGTVAGVYLYSDSVFHGFLGGANGGIEKFDVSGIAGAEIAGINDWGQVAGTYVTSDYHSHGFLRNPPMTLAPPDLAGFSMTKTDIAPSARAVDLQGTFTLGGGRTINPLTHPLIVKLHGPGRASSIAIPGGLFHLTKGRYVYQGVRHGVRVNAIIVPAGGSYQFSLSAAGVPGLPSARSVTVTLIIGNNSSAATVTATIH